MLGDYTDLPASPLLPFGHGLSYTRFEYGALSIDPAEPATDAPVTVTLDVANVGDRPGEEVVQLYLHDAVASTTRPVRQLAGFARVDFEPGQTRRIAFRIDPTQLALLDPRLRWVVEPGDVEVRVGASSADVRAEGRFRYVGPVRPVAGAAPRPTSVEVDGEPWSA
jgi:beta-glucosidase